MPIRLSVLLGILAFVSIWGVYLYAHNLGYEEKSKEDEKALQIAKEKQTQALAEITKLNKRREVIYRERIKEVHRFQDDSGCLDNPFPDKLYHLLLDGYRSL
jgi:cell division protein FtsB